MKQNDDGGTARAHSAKYRRQSPDRRRRPLIDATLLDGKPAPSWQTTKALLTEMREIRILRITPKEGAMLVEKTVSASEFARNFGRYRDEAASGEIVNVTNRGRVIGGFLSAKQLEEYRQLRRRKREALRIEDLPDDLADELEEGLRNAEY